MQPNVDNGGRWLRVATEKEIRRAMQDKNNDIIEVPIIQMAYVISHRYLVAVRCSIMGGDVFDIECAWRYGNDIALRLDKEEIRHLAAIPV